MTRAGRHFLVWITAIYWLALFGATHIPPTHLPRTHISDKIEHLAAYAILAALLFALLSSKRASATPLAIGVRVVLICMIYGAFDEITQALPFIRRTCSIYDWIADVCGALIAVMICAIAVRFARR